MVAPITKLALKPYHSNSLIENLVFVGTPYTAGSFIHSSGQERVSNVRFRRISGKNDIAAGQHYKWGTRCYNLENSEWDNLTIQGLDKEHAFYNNVIGALRVANFKLHDCGAQGPQIVNRRIETYDKLSWQVAGIHSFTKGTISMCGQERGQGRAAFSASFFGKQDDPYVESKCTATLTGTVAVGDKLTGALSGATTKITKVTISDTSVAWEGKTPMKATPTTDAFLKQGEDLIGANGALHDIVFVGSQVVKNGPRSPWNCPVELHDVVIYNKQLTAWKIRGALLCEFRPYLHVTGGETRFEGVSDSDLWHVHRTPHTTVEGHKFHGTKYVDITHAQTVSFAGCTTDSATKVRIDGQVVGLVSDDINWTH